ncbi:MAG: pentapeptide repeat-containing protein [Candidatus Kapabacteria bacterium]|nr:pentapeptide repeat-containing protein [Candidatus Kapabacteria bacterium]
MKEFIEKHWKVAILVVAILSLCAICLLPDYLVDYGKINDYEKYHQMINDKRAAVIQVVGGILFLFGMGIAYKRAKAMEDNAKAMGENAKAAQNNAKAAQENAKAVRKQVDEQIKQNEEQRKSNRETLTLEQYTKAIDQLGNDDNIAVRLGAINSLEQIMNSKNEYDSKYLNQIIELLAAYIRKNREFSEEEYIIYKNTMEELQGEANILVFSKEVDSDVIAIITVLGRRENGKNEKVKIDLSNTNWIEANLSEMNLEGFTLYDAHLEDANLMYAHLEDAMLYGVHLNGAILSNAHLNGAFLDEADLKGIKTSNPKRDTLGEIPTDTDKTRTAFIRKLEKAEFVAGIQLDKEFVEIIMDNKDEYQKLYNEFKDRINKEYPDLYKRIKEK